VISKEDRWFFCLWMPLSVMFVVSAGYDVIRSAARPPERAEEPQRQVVAPSLPAGPRVLYYGMFPNRVRIVLNDVDIVKDNQYYNGAEVIITEVGK
jgi:hypothetical protein